MAMMMGGLYHALRAAGASEENAARASEDVAAFENRLAGFENQFTELRGDTHLIKRMIGFVLAMLVAIPGLLLRVLSAIH